MDDLIAFLNARLDEDERYATNGGQLRGDRWTALEISPSRVTWEVVGGGGAPIQALDWQAEHIARHNPKRVLDEVAAKRKLLQEIWAGLADFAANIAEIRGDDCGVLEYRAGLLKLFALPYADHPDYDEAWRP